MCLVCLVYPRWLSLTHRCCWDKGGFWGWKRQRRRLLAFKLCSCEGKKERLALLLILSWRVAKQVSHSLDNTDTEPEGCGSRATTLAVERFRRRWVGPRRRWDAWRREDLGDWLWVEMKLCSQGWRAGEIRSLMRGPELPWQLAAHVTCATKRRHILNPSAAY